MIKIGMLVGDRYEIFEKIGTGGMSDVYKAKDHKLNRFVAVKVLKQEFSENANFVAKFRVEAQAAAGLMHPNIVNVYDVGQEDGVYYIVMELVEGITLKKYIEKKARISYKEAVSIAIQVCMGIEAAHNNHIIHRDIKPQNIIISKEGKVKVTDFGIAKAATSNTITSNVMGSVHYTSPEQARGGYSDEKSDIYSMGITLFEMLTGRVPFNGETTVAIAIKHIQEEMPSPRFFVSEIPVSVEQIVLKCCQKSPDRRYQSMGDLIKDLKYALMNPDDDFVKMDSLDEIGKTKTVESEDISRIRKQSKTRESLDDVVALRTEKESRKGVQPSKESTGKTSETNRAKAPAKRKKKNSFLAALFGRKKKPARKPTYEKYEDEEEYYDEYEDEYDEYEDGYEDSYDEYEDSYDDDDEYYDEYEEDYDDGGSKMEKITTLLAIIAAILIGVIIIVVAARALGLFGTNVDEPKTTDETEETAEVQMVEMIEVVGHKAEDVKRALIEVGLTPEIQYEESSEYPEGIVMKCSAKEGEVIPQGTNVIITVSAGETGVEVPDVVGMTEAEAVSTLVGKGFVPSKAEGFDDYIQAGCIYKQSPDGKAKAPAGTTIAIYISKGPEEVKVAVPDLKGKEEDTAMAILTENGLELGIVSEVNNEDVSLAELICDQSIPAGTYVEKGTKIDVSVSIGPVKSTYKFEDTITAPSQAEDPYFKSGTKVLVALYDEEGTVLYNNKTTDFPIPMQSITGINTETGHIVFQYINEAQSTAVTNEDGSITTYEVPAEEKTITRDITFIAE